MYEQAIILFFLIITVVTTLFLYVWKAKKTMEYKNDERWQCLQNKANNAANSSNAILILLLAVGSVLSVFWDIRVTLTFNRFLICGMFFIGLRNAIELIALTYLNKRM